MLQHKHKPIDPRCWTIPRTHKPSDFWVPIVKQPRPPHCHHATSEAASQARHVALPLWHHSVALSQRSGALSHMTGQNLRGSVPEMAKNGRFPKLWHPLCFFGLIKTSYWGTPMTFRFPLAPGHKKAALQGDSRPRNANVGTFHLGLREVPAGNQSIPMVGKI